MTPATLGPFDFKRVVNAAQKIEERLLRSTGALEAAGVPYAVIGGNAVANWVSRVDESLVRFTRDIDLLLRRQDLDAAEQALASVGFLRRHARGIEMFLDGPDAKAGDAVHVLFAGELVRATDRIPLPEVEESERGAHYHVASLEALLRMKLTSDRDKDRMHLRDLVGAGLVDETWLVRLPEELRVRLQHILDTPDG
jgi:hypothetical protein